MYQPFSQNIPSGLKGNYQEKALANRGNLKVLAWADSAIAGTGFGVVSRHVLQSVYNTGRYDINHLAINHHGDFVDPKEIPWQMQPARLLDQKDGHGMKMFLRTIAKGNYDIIWILNDLYVTHQITQSFTRVIEEKMARGGKRPVVIFYYPVDCHVQKSGSSFLPLVDIPVCYTDHGRAETLLTWPEIENKLVQIPHGVDTHNFKPLDPQDVARYKAKLLRTDKDPFVVINVNRNSARKQLQYSMLAFREFKKKVPNSIMYVHSATLDQGGDLRKAVVDLGLDLKKDIIFPMGYGPSNPVSPPTLNMLYNVADLFLTTHLGEGWGLTVTEAMAAGIPVVAPNNTCMPQQLGENSERGYLYPCNDVTWIDDSGFRPKGLIPDIVYQMIKVYQDGSKYQNDKVKLAIQWAKEHDWKNVHKNWTDVFLKAEDIRQGKVNRVATGEIV